MRLRQITHGVAWLLFATVTLGAEPLQFNRDIRPILSDSCFSCHGPDASKRKGKRRLDTFEGAVAERDQVRAIVPGEPDKSEVWLRVSSEIEDEIMPPSNSHKKLSAAQKMMLRQWIAEGATYQPHWAYASLRPVDPPAVRQTAWPRNPIDRFILARLEQAGLAPVAEADSATLVRRVSLDLTGLPPAPEAVRTFEVKPSPDAYLALVERLLSSPHYGERMAVDWLDAARFADTNGYQVDRDREMYAWRDWVIRAFNDNKPFDQFTIEQLAGDLLPDATLDQQIATGFHRNHMVNEEGGVIPEEFLAEYTADRVETTAMVWLGQTFNCTRCHDHKFDPFTQRDFYSLKAFFHNVPEKGVADYSSPIRRNNPPLLPLPAPAVQAQRTALEAELPGAEGHLAAVAAEPVDRLEPWAEAVATTTILWREVEILGARGADIQPQVDAAKRSVQFELFLTQKNDVMLRTRIAGDRLTALRFQLVALDSRTTFWWNEARVFRVVDGHPQGQPLKLRAAAAGDSLPVIQVARVLDADRKSRAVFELAPGKAMEAILEFDVALQADPGKPLELEIQIGADKLAGSTQWRIFETNADPELLVTADLVELARKSSTDRTPAQQKKLQQHRLAQRPDYREAADRVAALKRRIAAITDAIPTTLVMAEMGEPRPTHVLVRGEYDQPGERVGPATPMALPPMDSSLPRNRLGLARWLVSAENPLTARVIVNRFWQAVFGTGLVKTSDDFGSQGSTPSHPELLDWLAGEFIARDWDVKHILRLIVTSATYQQQSRITPALLERDPENVWLARGPRFRLQAEFVRDQALAVSGLLVPKLGGPSVKPYHPAGLYEQVTSGTGYVTYVPGNGPDLYRRSLYTYWKRSVPNPALLAFDMPFRETCTVRRPRSNTALQALNLMNDPIFVEASRGLAQRMMRGGGRDPATRIEHGFRLLLARMPGSAEMGVLTRAYQRARDDFQRDPNAAGALLRVGESRPDPALETAELAALTIVASTLLCLDEVVNKN